jgi:hypothetical protein
MSSTMHGQTLINILLCWLQPKTIMLSLNLTTQRHVLCQEWINSSFDLFGSILTDSSTGLSDAQREDDFEQWLWNYVKPAVVLHSREESQNFTEGRRGIHEKPKFRVSKRILVKSACWPPILYHLQVSCKVMWKRCDYWLYAVSVSLSTMLGIVSRGIPI